jgi:hypothetical protein
VADVEAEKEEKEGEEHEEDAEEHQEEEGYLGWRQARAQRAAMVGWSGARS